ncbi:MAG: single-stranded DNA-binding protein [Bacilli bacterium]
MNVITLIGRLTADPELRYTPTGKPVASMTLAVDRQGKKADGTRDTDFINIVVWDKLGELCAQYLRKGKQAAVEGRLQIRQYENKEGQKVRVAEVIAHNVQFLSPKDSNTATAPAAPSARSSQAPSSQYQDDPFANDDNAMDIVDDDLPF